MMRGMLKNLLEAGYLENIDNCDSIASEDNVKTELSFKPGLFKLTARALDLIESGREKVKNEIINDIPTANEKLALKSDKELKITKFDLDNIIQPAISGILLKETIALSTKRAAIEKRISTLLDAGLLLEKDDGWQLTDELLDRAKVRENINLEHQLSHSKKRSLDHLTVEQRKTIEDIKDFFNLSGSQILKFIYKGNEKIFKSDMEYLLKKGIFERDLIRDVYILSKAGTKLAAELTGDSNIFGSKIHSRQEELRHDLLIYSAFKDMEAELKSKGKVNMYDSDSKTVERQ